MRWLTVILIVALILLQTRLWFGEGSLFEYSKLEKKLEFQKEHNEILESRNQLMVKDIQNLNYIEDINNSQKNFDIIYFDNKR